MEYKNKGYQPILFSIDLNNAYNKVNRYELYKKLRRECNGITEDPVIEILAL